MNMLALVLTGGGARAAYQVGVLGTIAERRPELSVPIITGVSAGAINAVYLAGREGPLRAAVEGLRGEWGRLTSEKIYGLHSTQLVMTALRSLEALAGRKRATPGIRGLFDTTPLRAFLRGCLDFPAIDARIASRTLRAVALSATSYSSGDTVTFVQGVPEATAWERAHRIGVCARLTLDHVMASSAIPIIFPAARLNGGFYGDGSVRQTFPLSPAVHLGARRILAIGTRPVASGPKVPASPPEHPSPARAMGLLLDSVFMDHLDADAEVLTRVNGLLSSGSEGGEGLSRVEFFMLRPSRDLGALAAEWSHRLPRALRLVVEGMGGPRHGGADFLSYLLFDPAFTSTLIALGESDTRAQWPAIERLLGPQAEPARTEPALNITP